MCLFVYRYLMEVKDLILKKFKIVFEEIKLSNLSIEQKIRIMRFTCKECWKSEFDKKDFNLILLNSLCDDNIYNLAFKYNKQIIRGIKEQSQLYLPFLQLDNYILFNYYTNQNSYTLSMEPLTVTKNHLLSLYEPFLFISTETKKQENKIRFASQCTSNDITMINQFGLFGEETGISFYEKDKNLVIPISMELLHEKNGHSKKLRKNKRSESPIHFFDKNNLIELKESDQKIVVQRGKSGRIVQYFIRYNNNNIVNELKMNFIYGDLLKDTKYFTNKDFKDLYEKMEDILSSSKHKKSFKSKQSNCEINDEQVQIEEDKQSETIHFNEPFDDNKLESYEQRYLLRGKYFVYPDSIPFIYPSKDNKYNIPLGLKRYFEKYKKHIEEGKKFHYGLDYPNNMEDK